MPQVLPCGHTLCKRCLNAIAGTQSTALVACPACRREAQQSAAATNFGMLDMVRAMETMKQTHPPSQQHMEYVPLPSAPPRTSVPPQMPGGVQPWEVGRADIYNAQATQMAPQQFSVPESIARSRDEKVMVEERKVILRQWGHQRERTMHRFPKCLMDQMVSGSGLYPIRLLDNSWFTEREKTMVMQLEQLLQGTGHSYDLARDMLAPIVYDVDVRIILDNSGSMQLDMFGRQVGSSIGWSFQVDAQSYECPGQLQRALESALPLPAFSRLSTSPSPATGGLSPHYRRWYHARETLRRWKVVYDILCLDPLVYLLNPTGKNVRLSEIESVFANSPQGTTPMTETLATVLRDARQGGEDNSLLILVLTDGEANNMQTFNTLLDSVQNGVYQDTQVCLMGLSLVKEDIEWFENEECDETRIRTVEAFEVEQRQIQLKEVVKKEGNYNFAMHTYRVLVTNFFPADYDYEAHRQNLRHRFYITLHGRDRWYGINSFIWKSVCSNSLCPACFLATCCHCRGWCQGNECGKYQMPEILEGLCEEE